jgi:hypothetical protein
MDIPKELDPRVKGFETKLKLAGVAVVTTLASGVVIVGGLGIIAAGGVILGALAMVNVVPVAARWMALRKQSALTQLAETFSEETVRIDESEEAMRVSEAEKAFTTTKSELEGAIEEMRSQLVGAMPDEQEIINAQIQEMENVITAQAAALRDDQEDLKELRRVNRLLISMDRAARAMSKSQGGERNPEERQRLVTARNAIKTRMRSAIAGQQVEAMRREVHGSLSGTAKRPAAIPQVGHSTGEVIDLVPSKESVNVPNRR